MKHLKTYEKLNIVEIEIENLISDIKTEDLYIVKTNSEYAIYKDDYTYIFSQLLNPIPVNSDYKGDGYSYEFKIYKITKSKYNDRIMSTFINKYKIDKKYWNEIEDIYNIRKNVYKYNL